MEQSNESTGYDIRLWLCNPYGRLPWWLMSASWDAVLSCAESSLCTLRNQWSIPVITHIIYTYIIYYTCIYIYRQRNILKGYTDVRMQTWLWVIGFRRGMFSCITDFEVYSHQIIADSCSKGGHGISQFCLFKLPIRSNFPPNVVVEWCTL